MGESTALSDDLVTNEPASLLPEPLPSGQYGASPTFPDSREEASPPSGKSSSEELQEGGERAAKNLPLKRKRKEVEKEPGPRSGGCSVVQDPRRRLKFKFNIEDLMTESKKMARRKRLGLPIVSTFPFP